MIVAKDMGGANATVPLAEVARKRGDQIVVVSEGLASVKFEAAGFPPYFKGSVNCKVEPFTVDAAAMIRSVKPNVVVCAEGSPNNLEGEFARAANAENRYVVAVNDFWNGSTRLKARPDLVLAVDEHDGKLSQVSEPQAKVVIAGNVGVPCRKSIEALRNCPEVETLRSRFDQIIVYTGAGESTDAEIEALLASLAVTGGYWGLIPRFHPKHAKLDHRTGGTCEDFWVKQLSVLGGQVVYLDRVNKTDPIAVSSDVVVGTFSTLLTTAAVAGKACASLWIPAVQESLKKQAGLDEIPIVKLGCSHLIEKPTDLSTLSLSPVSEADRAKLKPFNAELAYEAISEFVGPV